MSVIENPNEALKIGETGILAEASKPAPTEQPADVSLAYVKKGEEAINPGQVQMNEAEAHQLS